MGGKSSKEKAKNKKAAADATAEENNAVENKESKEETKDTKETVEKTAVDTEENKTADKTSENKTDDQTSEKKTDDQTSDQKAAEGGGAVAENKEV